MQCYPLERFIFRIKVRVYLVEAIEIANEQGDWRCFLAVVEVQLKHCLPRPVRLPQTAGVRRWLSGYVCRTAIALRVGFFAWKISIHAMSIVCNLTYWCFFKRNMRLLFLYYLPSRPNGCSFGYQAGNSYFANTKHNIYAIAIWLVRNNELFLVPLWFLFGTHFPVVSRCDFSSVPTSWP